MTVYVDDAFPKASRVVPVRDCSGCGRSFKGTSRNCSGCQKRLRGCTGCGRTFVSHKAKCLACYSRERECVLCFQVFTGRGRRCGSCSVAMRQCALCRTDFIGRLSMCNPCRRVERTCATCLKPFRSASNLICNACRRTERVCPSCNRCFLSASNLKCHICTSTPRECMECHRTFRGRGARCPTCIWLNKPKELRIALARRWNNRRRAIRRQAAQAGPISALEYSRIAKSGPCVYCNRTANSVDHVRALSRDGEEATSNLVPCCRQCNSSKGDRLLTEWDLDLVLNAARTSAPVASELLRLEQEAAS